MVPELFIEGGGVRCGPELPIERGGERYLVPQLFIKGKSETEEVKKIAQFSLHPFFR